jgi:hypothetical protein
MIVRTYNHGFVRVEYPRERGYRMEPKQLPHWMHITVTEDNDSKFLIVHSSVHMNKEVRVGPSYSTDFTDAEIIKDLTSEIYRRFID